MQAHIDAYINCLFARASDESPDVRKLVCAALGLILGSRPDKLVPHIKDVVNYIAYCTKDRDESVALEACEFWLTFAEDQALTGQLKQFVPIIAPLLLDGMVYSEMDLAELDKEDEEDEAVPDKESDIKPKAYSGKKHGAHETNDPSSSSSSGPGKSREARHWRRRKKKMTTMMIRISMTKKVVGCGTFGNVRRQHWTSWQCHSIMSS
jgi:transportin-1